MRADILSEHELTKSTDEGDPATVKIPMLSYGFQYRVLPGIGFLTLHFYTALLALLGTVYEQA